MPRYNDRNSNDTTINNQDVSSASRNFRADLEDLVFEQDIFANSNEQLERLDKVNKDFDEFLVEKLKNTFKMNDPDARNLGDIDSKLAYMEKNYWKLKVPESAPLAEEASRFGKEMRQQEDDIKTEINDILVKQEKRVARNEELLKIYHEQLMEDTKRAEDLEIENAGLIETVPDITTIPVYAEVKNLKETIENDYENVEEIRKKIDEKETDINKLENEIDDFDDKIRNERAEVDKLTREKVDLDKEINLLDRELKSLRKNGTPEQITEIENQIKDKKDRRDSLKNSIEEKNTLINGYKDEKSKRIQRRTENIKTINTLNNEKRDLRTKIEANEKEHKSKLAELTKERDEDSEEVRRYKRNLKEIEKLDIAGRKDLYKDKAAENRKYKNEVDKNRQEIKDKFREYKIEPPVNVTPGKAAAVAAGMSGNEAQTQGEEVAQEGQAESVQAAKGGQAPTAGGVGASAMVPAEEYENLSAKELANNFYNDVVNKHYSPLEMQLKLSGFGFSKFVNVCEHLSPKQRKNMLPILKERRLRLKSEQPDQEAFDRVFGRGVYELVFDSGSRLPRDLNTLTEEEIRKLSIVAEEYNKNLLSFSDDDIKVIESKFFDVLANSAVVDMYESSSTLKGRFSNFMDRFFHRQKVQVVKELRGAMCRYHEQTADKFYNSRKGGNKLIESLRGEVYKKSEVESQGKNVKDLENGGRSALEDLYRNAKER